MGFVLPLVRAGSVLTIYACMHVYMRARVCFWFLCMYCVCALTTTGRFVYTTHTHGRPLWFFPTYVDGSSEPANVSVYASPGMCLHQWLANAKRINVEPHWRGPRSTRKIGGAQTQCVSVCVSLHVHAMHIVYVRSVCGVLCSSCVDPYACVYLCVCVCIYIYSHWLAAATSTISSAWTSAHACILGLVCVCMLSSVCHRCSYAIHNSATHTHTCTI